MRNSLLIILLAIHSVVSAQTVLQSKDFSLTSPFNEPDGRNDIVSIGNGKFIALAKAKGNMNGKSDFLLTAYDASLNQLWQTPLSVDIFEDYKDIYFNGTDLVLLSVVHNEPAKTTKLESYGFDVTTGKQKWAKELESYQVGDWVAGDHKAKVKESIIDVICEHTNRNFITPFEYKHNIVFSPDQSKFVSYVYNYGEKTLTASVCIYDKSCALLKKGKVSIDNGYVSHGLYINNRGELFILNANTSGKLNVIRYNMDTKDFVLLELPSSTYAKEDFHVYFYNDDEMFVGNTLVSSDGKVQGIMYSKFDFVANMLEESILHMFDDKDKQNIAAQRKANKQMKGDETFMDYDITHFIVHKKEQVIIVLEKRSLYADGYPHIGRGTFEKSHQVELLGHIQAESILIMAFDKDDQYKWLTYLPKNQVYAANDGLNTVSFVLQENKSSMRIMYASSENFDAAFNTINLLEIDKNTGKTTRTTTLPNADKLILVKDYTLWQDDQVIIVGKKGVMGKASAIVKYKL